MVGLCRVLVQTRAGTSIPGGRLDDGKSLASGTNLCDGSCLDIGRCGLVCRLGISHDRAGLGSWDSGGVSEDWFAFRTTGACTFAATVENPADNNNGDVDLRVFDPSGNQVASSLTGSATESVSFNATATGEYKVLVEGFSSSSGSDYAAGLHAALSAAHDEIIDVRVVDPPEGDGE